MTTPAEPGTPPRPARQVNPPLPPLPDITGKSADDTSVEYSHYRTGLSHHRTELSEHRTDLSEFRTDLSSFRTSLSNDRTENSRRRTGMSIQRTRMSADRTLMSEIRTSLSLIGFGFTLYQIFDKLHQAGTIPRPEAARNFGAALIVLGILIIVGGIWRQLQFANELRRTRARLIEEGLIHGESSYPVSITLIVSVLLLALGVTAILSIALG